MFLDKAHSKLSQINIYNSNNNLHLYMQKTFITSTVLVGDLDMSGHV